MKGRISTRAVGVSEVLKSRDLDLHVWIRCLVICIYLSINVNPSKMRAASTARRQAVPSLRDLARHLGSPPRRRTT